MTSAVKHKFNNAKADGGDATVTRPSNWNDTHNAPEVESLAQANATGSVTADFSTTSTIEYQLTGAVTFTFTAPTNHGWVALRLLQDATGGRVVTWPGTVRWSGGSAPTLSGASKTDYISFYWNGTNYDGFVNQNY